MYAENLLPSLNPTKKSLVSLSLSPSSPMYKSELQVLCQRNSWSLPEYSITKCGFDHSPSFTSIVTVNGVPFNTTDESRTAKEAQNKVAKIAFDHFSSPNSYMNFPQPSLVAAFASAPVATSSSGFPASIQNLDVGLSGGGTSLPTMTETIQTLQMNETEVGVKDDKKFIDMRHLYKNRLQSYAQKRGLQLPEYSSEREGPPHASRFKSKVTIDGTTYGSPQFFPTIKEAEHAAAKVALESLSVNEVQEDDSGLYKNLLQELAQKEGLGVPKYETSNSGPSHMPTFVSTVEIGGQSFGGQAAKSKKQAELNAAKVAYTGIKEHKEHVASGRASPIPTVLRSGCQIKEALEASSSILLSFIDGNLQQSTGQKANLVKEQNEEDMVDVFTGDLQHSAGPKANLVVREEQDDKYKAGHEEKFSSNMTISNAEVSNHHPPPLHPYTDMNVKRHRCSSSADIISTHLQEPFLANCSLPENRVSSPSVHSASSTSSTFNSHNETPLGAATGMNPLPREKIVVYPRVQNMNFPDGATVLPYRDDKWVAVKMNTSQ